MDCLSIEFRAKYLTVSRWRAASSPLVTAASPGSEPLALSGRRFPGTCLGSCRMRRTSQHACLRSCGARSSPLRTVRTHSLADGACCGRGGEHTGHVLTVLRACKMFMIHIPTCDYFVFMQELSHGRVTCVLSAPHDHHFPQGLMKFSMR